MADNVLVESLKNSSPDLVEIFYTSPPSGGGTTISSFTASNNTTSSATYKAYIYSSSGAALDAVIPRKIVTSDRFDLGAPIIGQHMLPSSTLRMESSAANSISYRVTGVELS